MSRFLETVKGFAQPKTPFGRIVLVGLLIMTALVLAAIAFG